MNTDDPIEKIVRRFGQLKASRGTWETHWREIAERVLPRMDGFGRRPTPGEKHTEKQFDATAALALERFAAAMDSMLTPRASRWHRLAAADPSLNEIPAVRSWFDEVTALLFAYRYAPAANFASQVSEVYMGLGAFGTGGLFIEDAYAGGLRYRHIPLADLYVEEDAQGRIDTIHHAFTLTPRQAIQRYGAEAVGEKIREQADKQPDLEIEFLHCVKPNDEADDRRRDSRAMAYAAYDICVRDKIMVRRGGYRTMPYAVSRYVTSGREVYGRSPAMTVLPDIKMLNEMAKTTIKAAHKAVDPPILMADDGVLGKFNQTPGAANVGGVDDEGRPRVLPFGGGGRIDVGLEMQDQRRRSINDAFLVTLFQILVETPEMSATEVLERAREKGALLTPTMGRQQSELLGPIITRELDILAAAGALPEMPDELAAAGSAYDIHYDSPLSRAQQAETAAGLVRTIEVLTPLAQVDPTVLDAIDLQEAAQLFARVNGVPQKVMRTPAQIEAMKAQRAQEAQAAQLLAAAPVVGKTAKDLAQASQLATAQPSVVQQ